MDGLLVAASRQLTVLEDTPWLLSGEEFYSGVFEDFTIATDSLLARKAALAKLRRPWYAGGTITLSSIIAANMLERKEEGEVTNEL